MRILMRNLVGDLHIIDGDRWLGAVVDAVKKLTHGGRAALPNFS